MICCCISGSTGRGCIRGLRDAEIHLLCSRFERISPFFTAFSGHLSIRLIFFARHKSQCKSLSEKRTSTQGYAEQKHSGQSLPRGGAAVRYAGLPDIELL